MLNRQRYDLNGKVALITGAARGIGFETARALVARGARVIVTDLDAGQIEAAAGQISTDPDRVLALAADASDRAAMDEVVRAGVEKFGRLDICIPNAGIAPSPSTVRGIDPAEFERVIEVNLLGVWRTVRAAMPHVVEARGQFMLIASVYAFFNGVYASPYACAKAGVEQLGRALRVELAAHDVHTAVAYFGFIDTEMVRSTFDRDERGADFQARIPPPINRRLTPAQAGEALARGIERRSSRVIAPNVWKALFYSRGWLGPLLDSVLPRDPRLRKLTRRYDEA
jgi:NAD(P)-dependent dehydrogenase (short-subunit alcohol dehydrogenase family)